MDEGTKRTVLQVTVLVETTGSQHDHERAVTWAANRIKTAHSRIVYGYVAVNVTREGERLGMADHGEPSEDTKDILDDVFDVSGPG